MSHRNEYEYSYFAYIIAKIWSCICGKCCGKDRCGADRLATHEESVERI